MRRIGITIVTVVTSAVLLAQGLAVPGASAQTSEASANSPEVGTAATASDVEVTITDAGFEPPTVTVLAGKSVHWTNRSSREQSVTAESGLFDGRIQPGGGFSMAMSRVGPHPYHSSEDPKPKGLVVVASEGLAGPASARANDHIPDVPFPPVDDADTAVHPEVGVVASRSRILLKFEPEATVEQANEALRAAGARVLGGIPDFGVVLAGVDSGGGFANLTSALTTLRAHAATDAPSMDMASELSAIPRPPENHVINKAPEPPPYWDAGAPQHGEGGNWGLEASRFPQAWNLLDPIRKRQSGPVAPVETVVVDGATEAHNDLGNVTPRPLCRRHLGVDVRCTTTALDPYMPYHGNHVAGIIAADYDNDSPTQYRSLGTTGANPLASVSAIAYQYTWFTSDLVEVFDLLLDEIEAGRMAGVRVVNFSVAKKYKMADFANATCTGAPCTPNNTPKTATEMAAEGTHALAVAKRAARNNVMIVQAAGNNSATFGQDIPAALAAPFAWAAAHWAGVAEPNPIIVTEAVENSGTGLKRAGFSDVGGDISAPGVKIVSTVLNHDYDPKDGTSFAAPFVTAAIGYLLAYDPSLDIASVKRALYDSARRDVTGLPPRLDAFAALLEVGAAKHLVDVNDSSKDGNRRVERDPQNNVTPDLSSGPTGLRSDPDGSIDMRDFRRFRDARLLVCALEQPAGCPPAGDISLDGDPQHPKKDLNFDGCVFDPIGGCGPRPENIYPRFDFNGDGHLFPDLAAMVRVNPGQAPRNLTDIGVLEALWAPAQDADEGWTSDKLNGLLRSGDLEVHADDFFDAGATDVTITARRTDTNDLLPEQHLTSKGFVVMTVPNTAVEISASAMVGGEQVTSEVKTETLKSGEDKRLDLCVAHVKVEAAPTTVVADGRSTSSVTATLKTCDGAPLSGKDITFSPEPSGEGHASLAPASGTTDANGKVVTTFTSGTVSADYTITATADLGDEKKARGSVVVAVKPPLTISYIWRQTTKDWSEGGSTQWPAAPPGMPDCRATPEPGYCINSFTLGVDPGRPSDGLERTGTLTGLGNKFSLSEEITKSRNFSKSTYAVANPDGSNPKSGMKSSQWEVTEPEKYQNHHLPPAVFATDEARGMEVHGLSHIAELGYPHILRTVEESGDAAPPIEAHSTGSDQLLVPRGDGSALKYSRDVKKPIVLPRQADGSFRPYAWCGKAAIDRTVGHGYRVAKPDTWVIGADDLSRDPVYDPGDRPMPAGPGSLHVEYAFALVASYGPDVPQVTLPDCTGANPPVPDFEFRWEAPPPDEPGEGRRVFFEDRSTDPDHDIESLRWEFPGGETSTSPDPTFIFADDGEHTVKLTVTDTGGRSATRTKTVSVKNLPPTGRVDDARGSVVCDAAGTFTSSTVTFVVNVADPGREDKKDLEIKLTSTNPDWLLVDQHREGGSHSFTISNLKPGTYPVILTVTDKDGASASDDATIVIPACGEPPPETLSDPFVRVCGVTLDAEEVEFLRLVNAYRVQNGLSPVTISPTLNPAAERHAKDMVQGNFLDHTGSDGSSPAQRAHDAGYPTDAAISENLASGYSRAVDALFAWQGSQSGHNENMIDPRWRAIGISREKGSNWYWATSYGAVDDCADPDATSDTAPATLDSSVDSSQAAPTGPVGVKAWSQDGGSTPAVDGTNDPASLVAAFAISKVEPRAGEEVSVTNLSRLGGQPVGAVLDVGNGSGPQTMGPGEGVTFAYPGRGHPKVVLTAAPPTGTPLSVARSVVVTGPAPSKLEYLGPPSGPAGGRATLQAKLTDAGSGRPLAGLTVEFRLADQTVSATTDAEGVARGEAALPATSGNVTLSVTFAGTAEAAPAELAQPFEVQPVVDRTSSLTYLGPTAGVVNGQILLKARLTSTATGTARPGLEVTFRMGSTTTSALTDADGLSQAPMRLPANAGDHSLTVAFAGNTDVAPVEMVASIAVRSNVAPAADPGGPYQLSREQPLVLDGTRSRDTDPGDTVVAHDWDLNGDGIFGDITGSQPEPMAWVTVEQRVCGGSCTPARRYPIALKVSDSAGATSTLATSMVVVEDFALLVEPASLAMNPGSSNSFSVGVIGSPGFTTPVTLKVRDLPPGLTASFSPNPVTPSGQSRLTVTVGQDAQPFTSPLAVVGEGGGITREASGEVKVVFGLIPRCYATFAGTVTDRETGERLAGASVRAGGTTILTDPAGRFVIPRIDLNHNNQPANYGVIAEKVGYWHQSKSATALCGVVTEFDFRVLKKRNGAAQGQVVVGVPDPAAPGKVLRTETPVAARIDLWPGVVSTAGDGRYQTPPLELSPDNRPRQASFRASAPGFWHQDKLVTLEADLTKTVDFELLAQCDATFTGGRVVYAKTGAPAPAAEVYLDGKRVRSDASGNFEFVDLRLLLAHNNGPKDYYISAYPPADAPPGTSSGNVRITASQCDQQIPRVTILLPTQEPSVRRQGTLEGHVYDIETGAPVAGAQLHVGTQGYGPRTDANGYYRWENILIGYDDRTSVTTTGQAIQAEYWPAAAAVTLVDGQTTNQDFRILQKRYGTIEGTVRDAATRAPLAGVRVDGISTDATGRYRIERVPLATGNKARTSSLWVTHAGYWPKSVTGLVSPDAPTVIDVDLIKECAPARVVGVVVDAVTQQPIGGASVSGPVPQVQTNAAGRFELNGIRLQPGNAPFQVGISASKTGYYNQTKSVTVYCGATISLDFGKQQTALGTIVGTVRGTGGEPLRDVFIGSTFGGSAKTDSNGNYRLTGVPLGDDNSDRTWIVSAIPTAFPAQDKQVTAKANEEVRLDFEFSLNRPPVATDNSVTTAEERPVEIGLQASDPEGDELTYAVVDQPAHGTLGPLTGSRLVYTPAGDYVGPDRFSFRASDGQSESNVATVSLTVTPANDPPIANDDRARTPEEAPVAVAVLDNDTDPDGQFDHSTLKIVTPPINGEAAVQAGGTLRYTPAPDFSGADTLTYEICDSEAACGRADVEVTVTPVNDPPAARDASVTTLEDTPIEVTLPGSDPDGDALTYTIVERPAHGTLGPLTGSNLTYTPASDYAGSDRFSFRAGDGQAESGIATLSITVQPVNDPPVVNDDRAETAEDAPVSLHVLANDTDPEGHLAPRSLAILTVSTNGTATVQSDGTIRYLPAPDFNGTDTFTYQVCDADAACGRAVAHLSVMPVNDPPVANDDHLEVAEDTAAAIAVAANDTDVDGDLDPTKIQITMPPAHGVAAVGPDGTVRYQSIANYHGADRLIYEVCDRAGLCDASAVEITVTPVNDSPDCSKASPSAASIWSPNHKFFVNITVRGVTDVEKDPVRILVDGIRQDEPVRATGDGNTGPDGEGVGTATARVRAERAGSGNGRVYHIAFTGDDGQGGRCAGVIKVQVPHDKSGPAAVDDGPLYDSTAVKP
jgi:uncharacterized protein YkwD/plastocyanin